MKRLLTQLAGTLGTLALIAPAALGAVDARDPVGEEADYEVDPSNDRTMSMIRDGEANATVTQALPDHPDGPAYEVKLDYTFEIRWQGTREGTRTMAVPQEYFTEEFMEQLREEGEYVGPDFKMRHLGYADARTMDGNFYPNCDKILIYDIETDQKQTLRNISRDLFGVGPKNDIEDLEIETHVKVGMPVLGAVKLDVSGRYSGMRVKAGADYVAP